MTTRSFTSYLEASAYAKQMVKEHKANVRLVRERDEFIVECTLPADVHGESKPENTNHTLDEAKVELEHIFTAAWKGANPVCFERHLYFASGKWTLDFYFNDARMGVVVDGGGEETVKQLFHDVELELAFEGMGITLVRFSIDEIYGDRVVLTTKLKKAWKKASSNVISADRNGRESRAAHEPATFINKGHKPILQKSQESIDTANAAKEKRLKRAIEFSKNEHMRRAVRIADKQLNKKIGYAQNKNNNSQGGWTSLSQGVTRMGDSTYRKQSVSEGIAGTRDENKKMRGQLWGDMLKRGR